ncbi:hypothetical protein NPIL_225091 [Nephila pilipes]|uniref:Uncharacterized protein n=1 Tax=Nephila pilipes TaxID=299642 RepID=A0A8X6TS53_NEPPI|nr:hypothetical protein NPIL_225091 [Nephila pilipes]
MRLAGTIHIFCVIHSSRCRSCRGPLCCFLLHRLPERFFPRLIWFAEAPAFPERPSGWGKDVICVDCLRMRVGLIIPRIFAVCPYCINHCLLHS